MHKEKTDNTYSNTSVAVIYPSPSLCDSIPLTPQTFHLSFISPNGIFSFHLTSIPELTHRDLFSYFYSHGRESFPNCMAIQILISVLKLFINLLHHMTPPIHSSTLSLFMVLEVPQSKHGLMLNRVPFGPPGFQKSMV